jgi:hypothetical protein
MEPGPILRAVSKELNAFVPLNHRKVMLRLRSEEKELWSERFWLPFNQVVKETSIFKDESFKEAVDQYLHDGEESRNYFAAR